MANSGIPRELSLGMNDYEFQLRESLDDEVVADYGAGWKDGFRIGLSAGIATALLTIALVGYSHYATTPRSIEEPSHIHQSSNLNLQNKLGIK